ncbi:MAG: sulfurtransferase complex subunit TusB [Spirochaetota bacterium]|nr:sulfurtransferase complex subunit TusB [Spirochaetota bacterium]
MLHTINKSPLTNNVLYSCINYTKENDPILLYEDAVFVCQKGNKLEPIINNTLKKNPIYALKEDLDARGITNLVDGIKIINYSGFVDLVEQHKVMSWL